MSKFTKYEKPLRARITLSQYYKLKSISETEKKDVSELVREAIELLMNSPRG